LHTARDLPQAGAVLAFSHKKLRQLRLDLAPRTVSPLPQKGEKPRTRHIRAEAGKHRLPEHRSPDERRRLGNDDGYASLAARDAHWKKGCFA